MPPDSADVAREWLETNGLGGFACGTVAGMNTRRYHGLLTTSDHWLLLSKVEETLIVNGARHELSANFYPGVIHPQGFEYLTEFHLDAGPHFRFEVDGVVIEKHIRMAQGADAVICEYTCDSAAALELRPLVAFRDRHALTHARPDFIRKLASNAGCIRLQPNADRPDLWFRHNAASIETEGYWYYNFEYPIERERGFDFHEDLFCPFVLKWTLEPGKPATLSAATEPHFEEKPRESSSPFIIRSGKRRTIIAGYPWFDDWGRDTMVALPGLARPDEAREILDSWASLIDQGMIPNRAPSEFNSVDASLWFFEAVRHFNKLDLLDKLREIIDWHIRGTRFGIHMDADGLLIAGDGNTQLTWMDARVNGVPVTPRNGKPVEVQALWYNALCIFRDLTGGEHADLAELARVSLAEKFWNPDAGCLYDVIDHPDSSLRPNQVIALSLTHCAIPEDRARSILSVVERELLTPYGLRTLAPSDPRYCGRYEGPPDKRDAAYHQGTVWPWLLGPYVAAQKRFNAGDHDHLLDALRIYRNERGLGNVPEIFDGDPPHQPRGCFAQAWSSAALG